MKLVLINNFYPPHTVGGAELFTASLAEELAALGHQVTVITTCSPETKEQRETMNGVEVIRFFPENLWWNHERFQAGNSRSPPAKLVWNLRDLWNSDAGRKIGTLLSRIQPDIVHTNNLKGLSHSCWKEANKRSIPLVHTAHDYHAICWRGKMPCEDEGENCLSCAIYRKLPLSHLRMVDVFCSPSKYLLARHEKYGLRSHCSQVIRNGVRAPVFCTTSMKQSTDGRSLDLLYLGQLTSEKGIETLIEAFFRCPSDDLKLHIAGRGQLEDFVVGAAQRDPRIKYHGFVEGDRKYDLLLNSDILIVPSLWPENAPLSVIEGLMSGLAVIASQIGALPEIISDGVNGLCFQAGDIDELAGRVMYLDRNRDKLSDLRKRALDAREALSMHRMVCSYIDVYQRLISKGVEDRNDSAMPQP